jgi:hypothetical protein
MHPQPTMLRLNFHYVGVDDHNLAFVGLAYKGKGIVFRFIIEYSNLRDFYRPLGSRSIFIWGFLKDDILARLETWD